MGYKVSHFLGSQGSGKYRKDHNARVQRWLEYLTAFGYTLEYRKGSANGNADFLLQLPQPETEHDHSGSSRLTPVDDEAIYLVRARDLLTPLAWVGWCPNPIAPSWVGSSLLPLIFAIFAHTGHV